VGSQSHVYSCRDTSSGELCAAKVEPNSLANRTLRREASTLLKLAGCKGVLPVRSFLKTRTDDVLVMDLLGFSLRDLLHSSPERKLSLKTVCVLACETISMLEEIHSRGFLHRDIKPSNFMIKEHDCFIVDFGTAVSYLNEDGTHCEHAPVCSTVGTLRYASRASHAKMSQSRRDDLQSLGYTLLYLTTGTLPWIRNKQEAPYASIDEENACTTQMKSDNALMEQVCSGMAVSPALLEYMEYCRLLEHEAEPDYAHLRALFSDVMHRNARARERIVHHWLKLPAKDALYASDEFNATADSTSADVDRELQESETAASLLTQREIDVQASKEERRRVASCNCIIC